MNRGLAGQKIFASALDFADFFALIDDAWRRWQIQVFAHCLMGTHYHLAIQTPLGNLQRVMRHIDGVYTQRFNRRRNRDGPLFRGRYKAILIDGDVYLAAVVRYIHLNPVGAGETDAPQNYPWSSHRYYVGLEKAPRWLSFQRVLSDYGSHKAFHEFVLSGNEKALVEFYSNKRRAPILGNERFTSWVREGNFPLSMEHVKYETRPLRPRVSSVIGAVAESYGISQAMILHGRRGQRNEARQLAMYLTRELCDLSLMKIAQIFSLESYGGVGTVCTLIARRIRKDAALRSRIQQILEMIERSSMQKKT